MHLPCLETDLNAIENNAKCICDLCGSYGIKVAGVVKFSDGDPVIAGAYLRGGCEQIAVSRAVHLEQIKKAHPDAKTLLTRPPVMGEMDMVAQFCDICLLTEEKALCALDAAAARQGTKPGVVLMLDVGDLREGVTDIETLCDRARLAEQLPNLRLLGVGTNVACLNGVLPTPENLGFLVKGAEAVEAVIGRQLEIVSGGSTINLTLLTDGNKMPSRINHLRIGGIIANPVTMRTGRGVSFPGTREDTFTLTAEIVELQEKDSMPKGATKNWAGDTVQVRDIGRRKRAILAIGSQDIGDASKMLPLDAGVEIIGSSSDHTIVDVTDCEKPLQVGETLSFRLRYMNLLYAFSGRHVEISYR